MYKTFKGNLSEYRLLHFWVEEQLGKPLRCENCGTSEVRRYEWANKSGRYKKDIADWIRLCKPCHGKKDLGAGTHCKYGHIRNEENNYIRPNGCIECKICKKIKRKNYYWINKRIKNHRTIKKLNDAQVIEIRYLSKNMKVVHIAERFSISPQYVTNIIHGRRRLLTRYDGKNK